MWVELIRRLEPQARFAAGATEGQLAHLEKVLQNALPADLRALLSKSNGVFGEYGLHLIWSTDEIEELNRQRREDPGYTSGYMPLDSLLFFADAGDGEMFGLRVIEGIVQESDIYVWNPIGDSRTWVAPSIQRYLEEWLTGQLSL